METISQEAKSPDGFENRFGPALLVLLAFLIPIFVVPAVESPLQFSKVSLTILVLVVVLALFIKRSLVRRVVELPVSLLVIALTLLPAAFLVSAFFSSEPSSSFFGYQLGFDTFAFFLVGAFLAYLTALVIREKVKIFSILVALFYASIVGLLFQVFQFFFGAPLPFLADPAANLIGSWSDFALFAGLMGSLIIFALEMLPLSKLHRVLLTGTFFGFLAALIVTNIREAWIIFGLSSFIAFVLGLSRRVQRGSASRSGSALGIAVLVGFPVALFFLFSPWNPVGSLSQVFSINTLDVRPSLQSTADILKAVYADDPVFGSGPNTFSSQWLLHRPAGLVQTPFWNVSFSSGASAILSSVATGGLVIGLAWAFFFIALLFTLARALFSTEVREPQSYFVVAMTAIGVLFLGLAHLIHTPGQGLTLVWFIFIGLLLASLSGTGLVRTIRIDFTTSPRSGFAVVLVTILILFLSLGLLFVSGKKYASTYLHNRAVIIANNGDLDHGLSTLERAIALDPQDRYLRTRTFISLAQLEQLVRSGESGEVAQARFQNALALAIESARSAVLYNDHNFENVMTLALAYGSVVPLQIEGAFENASAAYERARLLNPNTPEIDWRLAYLYAIRGEMDEARGAIEQALSKKPDYTNAILLLAQIELNEGNLNDAIQSVRAAIFFEPQNPTLLYQLGILLLQNNAYPDAALALEAALQEMSDFANAAFFLAQTYAYLDRFDDATTLMKRLAAENPDSALASEYATALENGENPFIEVPTPPEAEDVIE